MPPPSALPPHPLHRRRLVPPHNLRALLLQPLPALRVAHAIVLARARLHVRVFPVLLAAEAFWDVVGVDELFEFARVFCEVHFAGDDGVEPAFDDGPDALEDPGGFVDKDMAEGFGVVRFEDFDHEFYGAVVLARM